MKLKNTFAFKLICAVFILSLLAGCKSLTMKKAAEAMNNKRYAESADMYAQLASSTDIPKDQRQTAAFRSAESYQYNHQPKQALKMYAKAQSYGAKDPEILYRLAQTNKQLGNYEEAIRYFKLYQKEEPGDDRIELMIEGCENALVWKEEKSRYTVESFKPANDKKADDFSPVWADRKNKSIMFTSDRSEGNVSKGKYDRTLRGFTDVWQVKQAGSRGQVKWGKPELVEGLNTKYNDGTVTFNSRKSKMYVTQCNGVNGKEPKCKIYEARKAGKGWQMNPDPLNFCAGEGNNRWNYGHPVLADKDKTMYFASDRPGGYGDTGVLEKTKDIWMVTFVRRGRTWSEPVNLGPAINTTGNEMFPYVHTDGTLYFSSDGHPGLGALDIFESRKDGEGPMDWSDPSNMKSPVNSGGDDFGIIMDATKEHGFFTSNRTKNQDDIFEFTMEPIECKLKGQVTDCDSGTAISQALVLISNNVDSTKIRLRTDERGYYETDLGINREYTIEVSKRSAYYYDAKPQYVSTMNVENSLECQHVKDFCMKNTCNDVFVLPIYYDVAKWDIREDAEPILDDLIKTLQKYPRMAVELGSHTDCRASYEYNRDLSQKRADEAIKYLVEKGKINPFRLEARGYGESQLVTDCPCEGPVKSSCSEDEHQQNRRTTIKVVNCNFDVLNIGVDYTQRNDEALNGRGSVYSPYLLTQQRDFLIKTKGDIDSFMNARALEDSLLLVKKAENELMAKYDFIPLSKGRGDSYSLYGYIGRKKVKFAYNGEERRTLVPQSLVEQLIKSGAIKASDFRDQGEKIKLADGTKLFGTSFNLPELKINDKVYKKVKCKMVQSKTAVLGYNIFDREYVDFEIKEDKIWLLKDTEE
ncbi:OmpA family protein [Bacteroidia bacterium]|nr:OmpA family protein [Bacteroidia bacterium]